MKHSRAAIRLVALAGLFGLVAQVTWAGDGTSGVDPSAGMTFGQADVVHKIGAGAAGTDDWASRIEGFSQEQWAVFEVLMTLDREQWELLQRLMSLDNEQLLRLMHYLEIERQALLTQNGLVLGPQELEHPGSAVRVAYGGINDVLSKLNTVISKVNGVKNVADNIKQTVGPNRPDVKSLLEEIDLDRLRDVLGLVKEQIGGIVDIVEELKMGFDTFAPNGQCAGGSPCNEFKGKLADVFLDLQDLYLVVQALECTVDPDAQVNPMNTDLLETVLDKAPPLVLYVMYRVLELVPDWELLLRGGLEKIPPALTSFCIDTGWLDGLHGPLGEPSGVECIDSPNILCCVLRHPIIGLNLKLQLATDRVLIMALKVLENWLPDDVDVQAEGVAAAGGGGGLNIKNPAQAFVKSMTTLVEGLVAVIAKIQNKRDQCLAADERMERDLLACTSLVEYVLIDADGGKFEEVADLVERRIDQMVDAGQENCDAVQSLNDAITDQDYSALCEAYQELTGNPGEPCPQVPSR